MQRIKTLLAAAFIMFACCACVGDKDTKIRQLLFNESLTTAYLDGEAFTGTAWTDDEASICIECVEGKVTSVKVYHENGNVAMEGTTLVGAGKTYDEAGNPIPLEQFIAKYPLPIKAIQDMTSTILISSELK